MLNKRSLTIFASTFALVLVAGVAFAQVGNWAPSAPERDVAATEPTEPSEATTTTHAEEEVEETTTTTEAEVEKPSTTTTTHVEEKEEEHEEEKHEEPEKDTTPPDIVILHPENGQHFDEKTVVFEGIAEIDSIVAAGPYVADMDEEGNWRIVLVLSPGANNAKLTATDAAGNQSVATVKVYYDVPEEKDESASKEFTAHQKWGENDQAEDIFWGTGIVGDKVWIVSDYGTTTTYVDETGHWEVKATWEGVPNNTEFGIVVEASNGRAEFGFYKIGPVEESHEFSANQQYGSCGEDVPYDVFWGTAAPGATVYVVSDFGSGTVVTDETGHWEIKVFFPESPFNDTFAVVVEADGGGRKVFEFTRTGSEESGEEGH